MTLPEIIAELRKEPEWTIENRGSTWNADMVEHNKTRAKLLAVLDALEKLAEHYTQTIRAIRQDGSIRFADTNASELITARLAKEIKV